MKVSLTPEQIERLKENPETKVSVNDPWWIIVAKVVSYILGLMLAGYSTPAVIGGLGYAVDNLIQYV